MSLAVLASPPLSASGSAVQCGAVGSSVQLSGSAAATTIVVGVVAVAMWAVDVTPDARPSCYGSREEEEVEGT